MKRSCQTIAGVAGETMPRDDGWRFLMLGWMLERAEMTCRLLDVRYSQLVTAGATGGFHHWLQTLKSASGSEAFRRRYRASMDPADVVEFLLLSRTFPRSVLFSCARPRTTSPAWRPGSSQLARPQRLLGRTRSDLEFLDAHELLDGNLHVFLDQLLNGVGQVAEAVALQYFRAATELDLHALGPYGPVTEIGEVRPRESPPVRRRPTGRGSTTTTSSAPRRTSCGPAPRPTSTSSWWRIAS